MPPIPGAIFPVDPTIGPDDPAYRYGVVVRVACGPDSNETLIFQEYDVITPGAQVIQDAIDSWRTDTGQGAYSPPPPPGDSSECVYTGRIVSVGRREDVPMFPTGR